MPRPTLAICPVIALAMVMACSRTTFAQSTISGQVKDPSGAAMPGVRVDAASPTLIEGSRSVITTSDGRYAIVDVRPGLYTITFTIHGFSSVQRHVEVRANLTTPVDAEMAIGSVEEIVNVAPIASTVDVQNATHPVTFSRSIMDSVPTARNLQSFASYVPGVHMNILQMSEVLSRFSRRMWQRTATRTNTMWSCSMACRSTGRRTTDRLSCISITR